MRLARRSPGRTESRRSGASYATGSSTDGRLPLLAVILAGGAGTRLWPLARAANPKQFLPLIDGKSPFRLTYERIVPLVGAASVLVVTGERHASRVRREVPEIARGRIIVEGVSRNTAASIALAALWILARHRDAIMVVLPADHWVRPPSAFRADLKTGIAAVRRSGGLVTVGIRPAWPDPGLGYILPSGEEVAPGVRKVRRFVEKPGASLARRLIRSGGCLWNSGVFIWRSTTILEELSCHQPDLLGPMKAWARSAPAGPWEVPARALRRIPAVPVDRAVLERSAKVLVVRGTHAWTDLGTWSALGVRLRKDRRGNGAIGRMIALNSARCVGINPQGLSVFVGVKDLVAVRSGEALLVCHLDRAQQIRDVVGLLRGGLGRFR